PPGRRERWGFGGHVGVVADQRDDEGRHGSAGTARALGFGGHGGVVADQRADEGRHGSAGTARALGVWGPCRGPHVDRCTRTPPWRRSRTFSVSGAICSFTSGEIAASAASSSGCEANTVTTTISHSPVRTSV